MADAVYLHLQGPGAESALLRLKDFFQSHAGLMLQALPDAPPDETVRGLRDQGKKLYAFVKEGRDWIAAGVTVAAIFLAPSAASAPQPVPFTEKVNATRELLQVVNDLRRGVDLPASNSWTRTRATCCASITERPRRR